jgi:two-component system cell cycle response regulator DivK
MKQKILVVEDNEDNLTVLCDELEYVGYEVISAANGEEAIEKTFTERPDLILMDISIPVIDGWEATRRLKADPKTENIPIIALTAHAMAGDAEKAKAAGCDGYIAKPCTPDEVAAKVSHFFPRREGE